MSLLLCMVLTSCSQSSLTCFDSAFGVLSSLRVCHYIFTVPFFSFFYHFLIFPFFFIFCSFLYYEHFPIEFPTPPRSLFFSFQSISFLLCPITYYGSLRLPRSVCRYPMPLTSFSIFVHSLFLHFLSFFPFPTFIVALISTRASVLIPTETHKVPNLPFLSFLKISSFLPQHLPAQASTQFYLSRQEKAPL